VGSHVRLQGRDRDIAVAYGLVVRAVVRLPLVLPFFESSSTALCRGSMRVLTVVHVIALGLHGPRGNPCSVPSAY
jgi:hypothetical protein